MKKIICLLTVISVLFGLLSDGSSAFSGEPSREQEAKIYEQETKIYSTASIDDDFANDRLLVVLNSKASANLKDYCTDDFPEIDVKGVDELTTETKEIQKRRESIHSEEVSIKTLYGNTAFVSGENAGDFNQILVIKLNSSSKRDVLRAIDVLKDRDDIFYAGPDYVIEAAAGPPNDLYYSVQWALNKIMLPSAWDISTGSSSVVVGVMDTGIDASHPDLSDRINIPLSRDFTSGKGVAVSAPTDPVGHGTHVAGIIGAHGNNAVGICGVCWNVSLVSLRILGSDRRGYSSYAVAALDFATANNIPIVNFSGGWGESSEYKYYNVPLNTAIANYPGLFICAAGNKRNNIDSTDVYPAVYSLPNLISVADTTSTDVLSSTSNYGLTTVDLAAPGTEIFSTYPHGYGTDNGTSMAAPHVAGVAALIKSIRPDLSATEIKAIILDNVDKLDSLSGKCVTGGRLNAYKAVRAATEPQTFTGDVNGDGRADIILSRRVNGKRAITTYLGKADGSFAEPITTLSTSNFEYSDPAFVGDFNGDGLTDVLVHWTGSGGNRQLLVYISKGDGSFYDGTNLSSIRVYNPLVWPCSFHVGDVNGDGKDDFIVHYRSKDGYRCALVYKGKASAPYMTDAASDALTSANGYNNNEPVYVGDFNGDGRTDMAVQWVNGGYRQLLIYTGKADGTFNAGANLSSIRRPDPIAYPFKNFITDVNGDGKDDFVVHWRDSAGHRSNLVYKGKSTSPYLTDAVANALTTTDDYVTTDAVLNGDVNGDGRSDMIVHWTNTGVRQLRTYTAKSDGSYNGGVNYATVNTYDPSVYAGTFRICDVNGDGRDDFVVKWKDTDNMVRFYTYRGTTSGSFLEAVKTTPWTNIPYYNSMSTYSTAATYRIFNVGTGKYLNVYGDNVTSLYNNQNVCLWSGSVTNEQKWVVPKIGTGVYIKSIVDQSYGLNVYRSGSPWNCDLCPISANATDATVDFIAVSGGYKIKLHNYDLYLSAGSGETGANVYWSASSSNLYQVWSLSPAT